MVRIFLVHRWDGSPQDDWYPWLEKKLEEKGHEVIIPEMPNPQKPKIQEWVQFLRKEIGPVEDNSCIFVGHSVGCQAILRYLGTIPYGRKVKAVLMVAPWATLNMATIKEEGPEVEAIARHWIETQIGWSRIRPHCENFVSIFSDNDCYVPLEENMEILQQRLDSKIIVEEGKGHFTSEDGVTELPILLEEIMKIS